jgi:hypothetical protein
MNWKEKLAKATVALRDAAESETARNFATRARQTAETLAQRAREGALDAAQAFVQANADPNAIKIQFLNARLSVMSPSPGFEIAHPSEGAIVVSDGANNGLIIDAAAAQPFVSDTIGQVTRLSENTYDLGPVDGVNIVVIET